MPIYVDAAIHPWKGKLWCHLTTEQGNLDELHAFALRLGLKREWFQANGTIPHYDITANKRVAAVRMGAVELSREEVCEHIRQWRKELRT